MDATLLVNTFDPGLAVADVPLWLARTVALVIVAGGAVALAGVPLARLAPRALPALRALRSRRMAVPEAPPTRHEPLPSDDLDQRVVVAAWDGRRAQVLYRGVIRSVRLADDASAEAGLYTVVEVQDTVLVVSNRGASPASAG